MKPHNVITRKPKSILLLLPLVFLLVSCFLQPWKRPFELQLRTTNGDGLQYSRTPGLFGGWNEQYVVFTTRNSFSLRLALQLKSSSNTADVLKKRKYRIQISINGYFAASELTDVVMDGPEMQVSMSSPFAPTEYKSQTRTGRIDVYYQLEGGEPVFSIPLEIVLS